MQVSTTPVARDLVLVGGGHAHALVLRRWGMKPWPGVRVTLISDVAHAPYSGMVPGHLSGAYGWDEAHIDLRRLCQWAGARFVAASATGLDLRRKRVIMPGRPPLAFDAVSLNLGSTPDQVAVAGAGEFATPSKPVPRLLDRWARVLAAVESGASRKLVVVGGGAGGVELALAMQAALRDRGQVTLVHQGTEILPGHRRRARTLLTEALRTRGIPVVTGRAVTEVRSDRVVLADGREIPADDVFWVTHAAAAPWLRESGLRVDDRGFVMVSETLQSTSHDFVFAAGDCATVESAPRPKSGVFAVRAARPLFDNLERFLHGRPGRRWAPQTHFLSLIGTGDGRAVASRGSWAASGAWLWSLKDRIDRKFMQTFSDLPAMSAPDSPPLDSVEGGGALSAAVDDLQRRGDRRCLGCAAKVGSPSLGRVMARLRADHADVLSPGPGRPDILVGLDAPDDAAAFTLPPGQALVQTVDFLSALVADPFVFGRVATLHACSDLFAMGATPHSVLAAALVPFGSEAATEETLYQMLSGVATELGKMNALLLGGHTAEAATPALALTCNGRLDPTRLLHKSPRSAGLSLVLTKPLGIGTLFAAAMRGEASGRWIDAATDSMLLSNQSAASLAQDHGATACTDVTGFGLLGHLLEMLRPAGLAARLDLDALPVLDGAADCARRGWVSSLHAENSLALQAIENTADFAAHPHLPLLCDPQTSGGLLVAVPPGQASALVERLRSAGAGRATVIGTVVEPVASGPCVVLLGERRR